MCFFILFFMEQLIANRDFASNLRPERQSEIDYVRFLEYPYILNKYIYHEPPCVFDRG